MRTFVFVIYGDGEPVETELIHFMEKTIRGNMLRRELDSFTQRFAANPGVVVVTKAFEFTKEGKLVEVAV